MPELFKEIIGKLFLIGFIPCVLLFIPMLIIVIFHLLFNKKLPKILLFYEYNELSEKIIKANKYKGANNPNSKEWIETQLIWQELRHFDIKDNNKLMNIQRIYKIAYILQMCYSVSLIIAGWGIGLSIIGAFIMAIIEKSSMKIIIGIGFFVLSISIFACISLTRYLIKLIRYY